jgi:hypothetical protein
MGTWQGLIVAAYFMASAIAAPPIVVALPGKDWRVKLDLAGFSLRDDERNDSGSARKMNFQHEDARLNLTVVMKRAQAGATASAIRDERWAQLQDSGPAKQSGKVSDSKDVSFIQYFLESPARDGPTHQIHIHTFFIHDGTRVEVHVSVVHFTEADRAWLDAFEKSIGVTRRGPET